MIEVEGLGKQFGGRSVLQQVSFSAASGEVVALLGPSGSGKTTLLRCIAGFESPDRGRVSVDGQDLTRERPEKRRFGMVFQSYALFPHLSVGRNVSFGLEGSGLASAEIDARVRDVLEWVQLSGLEARRIGELSGGMQQRVALARAVAPRPRLLLLDEPLSNLDPSLRDATRRELRARIRELSITTLLVTHEQDEAFELADRVAVLEGGRLHQMGTPEELYRQPASSFVARFVGRATPVAARVVERDRAAWAGVEWPFRAPYELAPGDAIDLFLRPEALCFVDPGTPGSVTGRVVSRRFGSPYASFRVAAEGCEIEVLERFASAREGDPVSLGPRSESEAAVAFRSAARP